MVVNNEADNMKKSHMFLNNLHQKERLLGKK